MMKYTKLLVPFLILTMFLITACGTQTTSAPTKGAFIGGTQGITATFEPFGVEEEGIFTIFDTESFPIEVTLHNKGEYEIKQSDVTVKLLGPSTEEFTGIGSRELPNTATIEQISELVPEGGEESISFGSDIKYSKEVNGILSREWFANVEYNYQTYIIIPEVCLKEDLTDERVCEVKGTKTFFVSGAPIIATSVEESTAGKGIMALKIKIRNNVANGKVTTPGEEFGVNDKLTYTIDDSAWECKSGGKVNEARLSNEEAEIVCKLKEALSEDTLSTKQLKLTLTYRFRDIIQETLRIKESSQ